MRHIECMDETYLGQTSYTLAMHDKQPLPGEELGNIADRQTLLHTNFIHVAVNNPSPSSKVYKRFLLVYVGVSQRSLQSNSK